MNETINNNTEENLVKPVLDNLGRSYAVSYTHLTLPTSDLV